MSFWVAVILSIAAGFSILFAAYKLYLPEKVLVPKEDIKAGSVIGQNDIGYITVSRRDRHALAVTDPRLVIGRFAKEKLFAMEPILSVKLTADPKDLIGVSGSLKKDETYITFKPNEAKWPNGLKNEDLVSVLAVADGGNPKVIGEKIKVLNISGAKTVTGQLDQIKNAVTTSENSITLSLRWDQVGPLLYGRTLAKEIWIMPEHPLKEAGGKLYEPGQLERIRQEIFSQDSAGKRNTKTQKPVSQP
ncbi:MAG: SAF domain-containing protein [Bacillota bacterium]